MEAYWVRFISRIYTYIYIYIFHSISKAFDIIRVHEFHTYCPSTVLYKVLIYAILYTRKYMQILFKIILKEQLRKLYSVANESLIPFTVRAF